FGAGLLSGSFLGGLSSGFFGGLGGVLRSRFLGCLFRGSLFSWRLRSLLGRSFASGLLGASTGALRRSRLGSSLFHWLRLGRIFFARAFGFRLLAVTHVRGGWFRGLFMMFTLGSTSLFFVFFMSVLANLRLH